MLRKLLESLFKIEPEEQKTALLLFLQCMGLVAGVFIVGRAIGNTLFLQRVDNRYLPYTYVVAAFAVSFASAGYARFAGRLRSDRLIVITAVLFAAAVLLCRGALAVAGSSLLLMGVIYVLFDIVGDISMIQFWTLVGDVFTARQSKRLFSFVSAGGTVAGVIAGGLLSVSVRTIGIENLLFVVAGLLLFNILLVRAVGRRHGSALEVRRSVVLTQKARRGLAADIRRVARSPYLVAIATIIAVITIVSVLVDYQWKVTANAAYLGDENGLAAYFGTFALATNGLALLVQVFIAGRVLERYGIRAGLSLLPLILILSVGGLAMVPVGAAALWAASAAKGGDSTLRYSVHSASMEMLYRPIGSFRPRAKAIIDGIAKPLWAAVGGLLIAALVLVVGPRELSYLTLALLVVWLVLVGVVRRKYVASLGASLQSPKAFQPDAAPLDAATIRALEQALSSDDPRQASNAMALLESFASVRWHPPLDKLLASSDPALRHRALEYLAVHGSGADIAALERFVDAPEPELRGTAMAGMLRLADDRGRSELEARLAAMTESDDERSRAAAARALALCASEHAGELERLLADGSPRVRVEAVRACKTAMGSLVAHDGVIRGLLAALGDQRTEGAAVDALAIGGAALLGRIQQWLDAADTPARVRAVLPRVLERIEGAGAIAALLAGCEHAQERTRHAAVVALSERARRSPEQVSRDRLEQLCHAQLRAHFQGLVMMEELGEIEPKLLGEALRLSRLRTSERVLRLVTAMYPDSDFQLVSGALRSPQAGMRANAVELLDNTVSGSLRPLVLLVFEDMQIQRKLAAAGALLPELEHDERGAWLGQLLHDHDPWLVTCALYELARDGAAPEVFAALASHPDDLVCETAIAGEGGRLASAYDAKETT